ncbi:D-alanyl-D-alanine carboxypeptidase/D-alanyl-D-alanine-endopeptidase (penicillin-binding protein 4) [Pontibacter ummariensis]|uniref:D-alanyl-D-alanine carboxypeptidase / D-alanyl-D-alanine-endopeptidase (Penicillin-binding protein 4) n=2 Tax=Pontibacter ummariensis TaxID=1610492 RepID=A0A239G2R5_9BACT|nr:D-alanyl-D-alanine carboxypeptidase/D-alanyl-D-alanine-endopeptidase (penicillin-binding protein 4) [Pontibacter ummariensis]SNS63656.1 D-alanyl-D-alanine carboxypeptidase / D-alanyl-D-alanine-endopeptidase (penicillin-binding protein 4) [Pontibacter ummariensis]
MHSLALAQSVSGRLASAFKTFQNDPQLRNGIASLYVVDAKTGKVVFDQNSQLGLAPASTQKIITSASAYELLGDGFQYKTKFALAKTGEEGKLLIMPTGDPTLGSWRWGNTKDEAVLKELTQAISRQGVKHISSITVDNEGWNEEAIPDGWMWQDVGNYYGAGPAKLNWRENQFDVMLRSGKNIGDPVSIVGTVPELKGYKLRSELSSAAAGTGDNAYIYFPVNGTTGVIRGTIPVNESRFKISGALPAASDQFAGTLQDALTEAGIRSTGKVVVDSRGTANQQAKYAPFYTVTSPSLDSIIYWFNRKSVNLYGEALLRTIGYQKSGVGSTDAGVEAIQNLWKTRGIPETELNIVDGSGLSPLNRVTTQAQVKVLQHARKQPWFDGFYASLPLYNDMKMKSGTIRGVKGYTGYHKAKDGNEYVFSFLINNYNGSSGALVRKMYNVLDELK